MGICSTKAFRSMVTTIFLVLCKTDTELCQGDTNRVRNSPNLRVLGLRRETQFWSYSEQDLRKPLCSTGFTRCTSQRLHEQSSAAEFLRYLRRWFESLYHGCISLQAWLSQPLLCQGDTVSVGLLLPPTQNDYIFIRLVSTCNN